MATTNSDGYGPGDFLVVEDSSKPDTWHLQVKRNGKPDHRLMGGAWAALHEGYRGNKYEGPNADEALSKLKALYEAEGMKTPVTASELPWSRDAITVYGLTEDGAYIFDDPGSNDVAIPQVATKRPSAFAKNLVQRLKNHFQSKPVMTADDVAAHIRAAAGHAGGKARAAAEISDWTQICPACAAAGHGATPGCDCPACEEGDPEDCVCQDLMDEQEEQKGMAETVLCSDDGSAFRLFVPVECGDGAVPDWIPYLPIPKEYDTQKYGKINLTPEKYDRLMSNFKANIYGQHLPVTLEHSDLSGAAGYLRDMRKNPNGSLDVKVEWNDLGRTVLSDKRFQHASAEFFDSWKNPATGQVIQDVPKGHTLTTYPLFKPPNLRALIASERGVEIIDSGNPAVPTAQPKTNTQEHSMGDTPDELQRQLTELQARSDEAGKLAAEAKAAAETGKPEEKRIALAEMAAHEARKDLADLKVVALTDQIKSLTEKAAAEKKAKEDAEAEKAKGMTEEAKKLTELEATNKAMAERVQALESDKAMMQFTETARTFAEGDEAIRKAAEFLRDGFASDAAREQYVTERKAFAERERLSPIYKALGAPGRNPEALKAEEAIDGLVKGGMAYEDAYRKAMTENPSLFTNKA